MENCIQGVLRVRDITVGDDFLHLFIIKGKGKGLCGSYSTAALRHIVLLPE